MSDAVHDEPLWQRDATWYSRPNTTTPKKYHRANPNDAGLAACSSRIVLMVEWRDTGGSEPRSQIPASDTA